MLSEQHFTFDDACHCVGAGGGGHRICSPWHACNVFGLGIRARNTQSLEETRSNEMVGYKVRFIATSRS